MPLMRQSHNFLEIQVIETVHKCNPAFAVLEHLGGKSFVSKWIGLDRSSLSRWCTERPSGTGGMIPQKHWKALSELSVKVRRPIKVKDLTALKV